MVIDSQIAKYTKTPVRVIYYDTGITDWENLDDAYKEQFFRNKVICKADVSRFLNQFFLDTTVSKYRNELLTIAKAKVTDANILSHVMLQFIKEDSRFAERIHYLFHSCPNTTSFGSYLIQRLADVFRETEERYRTFFRGRPEVVICISDGYLYFSFEDSEVGPLLPDDLDCEVLSYAKNWNGNIRYYGVG